MPGSSFPTPRLRYPVHTLEGKELLPAGSQVTVALLSTIADQGRSRNEPSGSLLQHGTVLPDLVGFLCEGPYKVVFEDGKRFYGMMQMMERVTLPLPLLRSLDHFRDHDPFTYRHILCVFALSTLLAQELMGTSGAAIQGATSGPMHDIGKLCVPLSIMKKRSALTRDERDRLRHHTAAGYVLLAYYFGDGGAISARVALEHHERRDGSGYPLGIFQKERMVEIVAVCDVYDALISPRPYRPTCYDNRTALEEMTLLVEQGRLAGDIVQALVAYNRQDKPDYRACKLSLDKRGHGPEGNVYGVVADETAPG